MRKSNRTLEASTHRRRRHESHATPPAGPTTPTPDPTDDDDFSSTDQQVYWAGELGKNPPEALTLALADVHWGGSPPPGSPCYAALLGTGREAPLQPLATANPNHPVMRQVARRYQSDGGGAAFDTFALTFTQKAYDGGAAANDWIIDHLYFALLDENQYKGLKKDGSGQATWFEGNADFHKLLVLDAPNLSSGYDSVSGTFKAAKKSRGGHALTWLSLRATLVGVVGMNAAGPTPIHWSRTGDAEQTGSAGKAHLYSYGGPGGTQNITGSSSRSEGTVGAFVVAWGQYEYLDQGVVKKRWAVSVADHCGFAGSGQIYGGPTGGGAPGGSKK